MLRGCSSRAYTRQSLPCNDVWITRDSLKNLKQVVLVKDYMTTLCSLMLDVSNMSEEDKLFNFLMNLYSWAQSKLRRQDVGDLNFDIATVDRLMDYWAAVTWSGKKDAGGKKQLDNKRAEKGNELVFALSGPKGDEQKDKKKQSLNTIMGDKEGGVKDGRSLQVPMVLLNALMVMPPEDPLGFDAIRQLALKVIELSVWELSLVPVHVKHTQV
ncbi:hypothetical protein CerSpe_073780 [Prunus speciosa]